MDRPWKYSSNVAQVSSSWHGVSGVKTLIVLGASYCGVGYDFKTSPRPTVDQPLGVPFPGSTWAEPEKANWVGHLVTRFEDQTRLVVYDFAKGGDTTEGVERQIKQEFLPNLVDDTEKGLLQGNLDKELRTSDAVWNSDDTLFTIWIGINDCGYSGPDAVPPKLVKLFGLIELLYSVGARNLMLIDIPPMDRSPAMRYPPRGKLSFEEWNDRLRVHALDFAKTHVDATLTIYSSWATFTRVLNNPVALGFDADDGKRRGGSIWVDHIHPTSKMHDEVAKDVVALLRSIPANGTGAEQGQTKWCDGTQHLTT
ncbi:carbohydrate esterase family 16 protein [Phanerochaete carnosa HHB-10118-sp]|uniref:Carbohydrate esterase family 16 protein n=1 Tax=Phanerochaete carnosa (strain HHB-10118-sp) TaxID=650164 RepID=K5W874_PHACS|nr:carbohydrate esterase family 16 protein [Phanerochaete carnosa HHB-10118-sp]EKM55345.1 carbohydrate esterase family 16 protein [Phanerochaete carnosa HHB-10118-sp]